MRQSITPDISQDHELDVLAEIHRNQKVKQRDIARAIGLSLGMTNAILKRLAAKGFIAMRKINSRNIHYLVTPEGIDLITRRSYRYLRRTVGHVVRYKERILSVFKEAAAASDDTRQVTGVVLVGESDLEFLVEWCAEKAGLAFRRQTAAGAPGDAHQPLVTEYVVASEQVPQSGPGNSGMIAWDLHLADLVVHRE